MMFLRFLFKVLSFSPKETVVARVILVFIFILCTREGLSSLLVKIDKIRTLLNLETGSYFMNQFTSEFFKIRYSCLQ